MNMRQHVLLLLFVSQQSLHYMIILKLRDSQQDKQVIVYLCILTRQESVY